MPPLRVRLAYRHQRPYGHGTGSFGYPLPPTVAHWHVHATSIISYGGVFLGTDLLVEGNTSQTCRNSPLGRNWLGRGFGTNAHTGTNQTYPAAPQSVYNILPQPGWEYHLAPESRPRPGSWARPPTQLGAPVRACACAWPRRPGPGRARGHGDVPAQPTPSATPKCPPAAPAATPAGTWSVETIIQAARRAITALVPRRRPRRAEMAGTGAASRTLSTAGGARRRARPDTGPPPPPAPAPPHHSPGQRTAWRAAPGWPCLLLTASGGHSPPLRPPVGPWPSHHRLEPVGTRLAPLDPPLSACCTHPGSGAAMPPADPAMPSCAPARCRVGAGPAGRLGSAPGAASPRACAWLCRPARPSSGTDRHLYVLAPGSWFPHGVGPGHSEGRGIRSSGAWRPTTAQDAARVPVPVPRRGLGHGTAAWGMVACPGRSMRRTHTHTRARKDHSGRGMRRVGLHDAAGGGAMGGRWRGGGRGVCWAGSAPLPSTRPTPAQARFATPARRRRHPWLSQRPDERAHGPARRWRGPGHAAGCARARGASQLQLARSLGRTAGAGGPARGRPCEPHTPQQDPGAQGIPPLPVCLCVCLCMYTGATVGRAGREACCAGRCGPGRPGSQRGAGLHPHVWWLPQLEARHHSPPSPGPPSRQGRRGHGRASVVHTPTTLHPTSLAGASKGAGRTGRGGEQRQVVVAGRAHCLGWVRLLRQGQTAVRRCGPVFLLAHTGRGPPCRMRWPCPPAVGLGAGLAAPARRGHPRHACWRVPDRRARVLPAVHLRPGP